MRVISGKYRGRKLKEFDLDSTRPTLDRVKEAIFNLIQFDILDSVVLDLFAGTGALGIECVSRGAKKVYLVDTNKTANNIIKENLKGMDGDYEVVLSDYEEYLRNTKTKFDIVLLDPPFKQDYGLKAIDFLIKNKKMTDNGIIIFETSAENIFKFDYEGFEVVRRKYGTVAVYKISKN